MNKRDMLFTFIKTIEKKKLLTKFIINIFDYQNFHDYNYLFRIVKEEDNIIIDIYDNISANRFNRYIFDYSLNDNKTKVIESDGRCWRTKEPAIMYFYKNSWYNVIGQLKKNGIYYYCNIASPYVIDGNTIKYIDYDLDLRVFPNGSYKILDKGEYKYHSKLMNYSKVMTIQIQKRQKILERDFWSLKKEI
jgi:protein associated with RNAse G/E